jgi:hypothetical protein
MPDYLLPCDCGAKTPVSTAHAGNTVSCVCGADLHVPTLRGLRDLPTVSQAGAKTARAWEDRHRVAFLLLLVSLVCLGVAVYLRVVMPAAPAPPQPEEIAWAVNNATPGQLFGFSANMIEHGLGPPPDVQVYNTRRIMYWGIGLVVALAATAQFGALAVVFRRRRR